MTDGMIVANSIHRISDDVLQVEEGSLYPALQRILIKGWVTAKLSTTAGNLRFAKALYAHKVNDLAQKLESGFFR